MLPRAENAVTNIRGSDNLRIKRNNGEQAQAVFPFHAFMFSCQVSPFIWVIP
jgi:hypothetical protein